jgi:hypothetical protein
VEVLKQTIEMFKDPKTVVAIEDSKKLTIVQKLKRLPRTIVNSCKSAIGYQAR